LLLSQISSLLLSYQIRLYFLIEVEKTIVVTETVTVLHPDPDVCIPPYPPDLNCEDVPYKNFEVTGSDPHGFDGDNDGIDCESSTPMPEPKPRNGDGCVEVDGYLLSEGSHLDERGRIVGSPCDPEEFYSDPDSTDPTVIDHCSDGWEEIYERCCRRTTLSRDRGTFFAELRKGSLY
jgi:hypothetical protein